MKWKVTFYNERVKKQILAFPKGILANLLHLLDMVEENSPNLANRTQHGWATGFLRFGRKEKRALDALFFAQLKSKKW